MIVVSGIIRVFKNYGLEKNMFVFKNIIFFFETKQYFQEMCFETTLNRIIAKAALDVRGKQCEIYAIYL